MKELYTSPEVELVNFKAMENLAASDPVSIDSNVTITNPDEDITIKF